MVALFFENESLQLASSCRCFVGLRVKVIGQQAVPGLGPLIHSPSHDFSESVPTLQDLSADRPILHLVGDIEPA